MWQNWAAMVKLDCRLCIVVQFASLFHAFSALFRINHSCIDEQFAIAWKRNEMCYFYYEIESIRNINVHWDELNIALTPLYSHSYPLLRRSIFAQLIYIFCVLIADQFMPFKCGTNVSGNSVHQYFIYNETATNRREINIFYIHILFEHSCKQ